MLHTLKFPEYSHCWIDQRLSSPAQRVFYRAIYGHVGLGAWSDIIMNMINICEAVDQTMHEVGTILRNVDMDYAVRKLVTFLRAFQIYFTYTDERVSCVEKILCFD